MSTGHEHHGPTTFLTKYVFSTDHKIIAQQFLFSSLLFVILGGLFALGVRYQLAWPNQDVPYKWLLPGKMTSEAPESNIALWKLDQPIKLSEAGAIALNLYVKPPEPEDETAPKAPPYEPMSVTLKSFPKGYAVSIPVYSRLVGADGKEELSGDKPIDAFVDVHDVMPDYNYNFSRVIAVKGTTVRLADDRKMTLVGRELLVPDGSGKPVLVLSDKPVLLDLRADATPIETSSGQTMAGNASYIKNTLITDAYLQMFTMHASIMIFFVIIPTLVGFFGNWAIPLMIGARDMAFPKLNMLSFWLSFPAGLIMLLSFWTDGGPAGGGWTMYPTLSEKAFSMQIGSTLWVLAVGLVGFSSVVGSLNYITTIINMCAPGMTLFRMPLLVWSLFITSALALLGTPVLTAAMVLLTFDRHLGTSFFVPLGGGQVLLFQHLFWFYSHPAVYIMILPTMGMASDILSTFSRKPIFGYKPMIFAMATITGLGFVVWGHHMFQSGMNPILGTTFMASTILIAVPSAIKTFNWLGTIWGGNIRFTPAMLNALAFVSMFVIGGLSGIFMASTPIDIQIHDTYFIVAHIHYVLFGGSIFGIFAAIYFWFPKLYGKQLNQKWGHIHFIMTIIAFNGTFFLMHVLGVGGHPRRYSSIMEYSSLLHLQDLNVFMSLCALAMGCAQIPFFYNVWMSLPRKLGRAMTAWFAVMIFVPMVAGKLYWSCINFVSGDTSATHGFWDSFITTVKVNLIDKPQETMNINLFTTGYTRLGQWAMIITLAILTIWMLRTLTRGGKWAAFFTSVPLTIYSILIAFKLSPQHMAPIEAAASNALSESKVMITPLDQTVQLLHNVFWSSMTHRIQTVLGLGIIAGAIIVGITFLIWAVGNKLRVPKILNIVMYAVFLPLWLCPFIFKQDVYVWLGVPALHQYAWIYAILLGLPGLLYVLLRRPNDQFGFAVDDNPWHANTLDWMTTSPPPHYNFEEIPTVYRGPYEYSSPAVEEDYLPQSKQLPPGVVEPTGH